MAHPLPFDKHEQGRGFEFVLARPHRREQTLLGYNATRHWLFKAGAVVRSITPLVAVSFLLGDHCWSVASADRTLRLLGREPFAHLWEIPLVRSPLLSSGLLLTERLPGAEAPG